MLSQQTAGYSCQRHYMDVQGAAPKRARACRQRTVHVGTLHMINIKMYIVATIAQGRIDDVHVVRFACMPASRGTST